MIYSNDVIFSKEECINILNSATDFKESGFDVKVANQDKGWATNYKKRKSTQSDFIATPDTFVYKKIDSILNKIGYRLICESFVYFVIKYKEGDFIWKHKDDNGDRLLSVVVQLNDGSEYEGGDFLYWQNNNELKLNRNTGFGMLFKTGVYHEVTPIIKGERNSFVLFINYSDITEVTGKGLI